MTRPGATAPAWAAPQRVGKVENDDRADWREAWALFPGDVAYVWHGALHASTVADSLVASGFQIRAQVIWAKDRLVLGRGHYHWQHEPCWYAVRGHGPLVRRPQADHPVADRQPGPGRRDGARHPEAGRVHAPADGEQLVSPGQAVYEPFSGSGTTLIAAEQSGRSCHAIELSPAYVDVAVLRWQAFTGQEAVLEGGGDATPPRPQPRSAEAER